MPENPSVYGYSPKARAFSTEFLQDTRNGIKREKTVQSFISRTHLPTAATSALVVAEWRRTF
jgi:hypothetical protein